MAFLRHQRGHFTYEMPMGSFNIFWLEADPLVVLRANGGGTSKEECHNCLGIHAKGMEKPACFTK